MTKTVTHNDTEPLFGRDNLLAQSLSNSFAQMIFESLSGEIPSEKELALFELILNLSIDHGEDTPSAKTTIEIAKSGQTISEAVASGILEINDAHGGAIEPAMELLIKIQNSEFRIKDVVGEYLDNGKKIPGFGHRLYKEVDPRAELILEKLGLLHLGDEYIVILENLSKEMEAKRGEKLPVNIDGAIAAALLSFGWNHKLGKAVFIIARVPGLCAQYLNNS